MPEGFDYDPAAIRAFAEVFSMASTQVDEVRASVGQTSAKAADFGNSWTDKGTEFEQNMAMLAEDLGALARHLGDVAGQLNQGTDLMIQTDTTGLRNIQAIDDGSGGGQ